MVRYVCYIMYSGPAFASCIQKHGVVKVSGENQLLFRSLLFEKVSYGDCEIELIFLTSIMSYVNIVSPSAISPWNACQMFAQEHQPIHQHFVLSTVTFCTEKCPVYLLD